MDPGGCQQLADALGDREDTAIEVHGLRRGRTPVWYTGWDNSASLRLAEKLGLHEVSRPVYLIRNP